MSKVNDGSIGKRYALGDPYVDATGSAWPGEAVSPDSPGLSNKLQPARRPHRFRRHRTAETSKWPQSPRGALRCIATLTNGDERGCLCYSWPRFALRCLASSFCR